MEFHSELNLKNLHVFNINKSNLWVTVLLKHINSRLASKSKKVILLHFALVRLHQDTAGLCPLLRSPTREGTLGANTEERYEVDKGTGTRPLQSQASSGTAVTGEEVMDTH